MSKIFNQIEKIFYRIRDLIWYYPDNALKESIFKTSLINTYKSSLPFSNFVLALILIIGFIFLFSQSKYKVVLGYQQNKLIEGVIMGVNPQGKLQTLDKVNPLLPSNVQLEKDLVELIYEPLIKYEYVQNNSGTWTPQVKDILASDVIKIRQGADYQINLKKGIKWHDDVEFTVDDVIATFNLVSKLKRNDNAYIRAIKQLRWEKIGDYSIRLCTKDPNQNSTCSDSKSKIVFSNFLELISIKIIPAHKLNDINDNNIEDFNAELFRSPIGTGKYKFFSVNNQEINLVRNDNYIYTNGVNEPQINQIEFKFYKSNADVVQALQNREINSFASISDEYKNNLAFYNNIKVNISPILVNQYWGMYFNLAKNPDGKLKGAQFFSDPSIRQAISLSIDRKEVINNALQGLGEEAKGPITDKSYYYNKNAGWFNNYDPNTAKSMLDKAGWTIKQGEDFRTDSNGNVMRFSLYFVDTYDRNNVAKVIQKELKDIGIDVIINRRLQDGQDRSVNSPTGWSLKDIDEQVLTPKSFDVILYGMNTFIDPDRFELFDSSQQNIPGLNIGSYVGSIQDVDISYVEKDNKNELINIPKVDKILRRARTYDPDTDIENRKKDYFTFQTLLAKDSPVVFLYNPKFIYYNDNTLNNIDLNNVSSIEDRFKNIEFWSIKNY